MAKKGHRTPLTSVYALEFGSKTPQITFLPFFGTNPLPAPSLGSSTSLHYRWQFHPVHWHGSELCRRRRKWPARNDLHGCSNCRRCGWHSAWDLTVSVRAPQGPAAVPRLRCCRLSLSVWRFIGMGGASRVWLRVTGRLGL